MATSTISEREGSVALFLFSSYCMSPGSKRPEEEVDGETSRPARRIPEEPEASQGAQVPHTQLGGNVEGRQLIRMALGTQSVPGALGVLPPVISWPPRGERSPRPFKGETEAQGSVAAIFSC